MRAMASEMTESVTHHREQTGPLPVFPFFVGCGRSGTTLVRATFSSHPELALPPEPHFLGRMLHRESTSKSPAGFSTDRFLSDLYSRPRRCRWAPGEER